MAQDSVCLSDVKAAYERIRDRVNRTPCLLCERLSIELDCELYFKAENLQHIGAFKARGALNAVLQLSEEQASRGVVTHSSGNHAAALARAAKIRGIPAHIVMPHNSAKTKVEAVRSLGFEPQFCKTDTPSREAAAARVQEETGASLVHPFDDPRIIAGQGTVALEVLEQVPKLEQVIAPVGGGGLMSGTLVTLSEARPKVEVYGAEPAWADDAYRSLKSGKIEPPERYDTVADGLRTSLGNLTFPIIQSKLREMLLVTEEQILLAQRKIVERAKLVVEPSAAVPLGALISHPDRFRGKRVVVILSGGNLDFGNCQLGK
ncbi:MAG: threonine/serine dehydratase [Planctomycetota bacterium]|nr:threonine/serine dehydratase [Planctomycetota bacterium]